MVAVVLPRNGKLALAPFLFLALILGLTQAVLGNALWSLGASPSTRAEKLPFRWEPNLFRLLSFGQVPVASHLFWLRAMTDAELTRLPRGQHSQLFFDLELATDLDPAFLDGYLYGGNLVVVVRDDAEGGRDLYRKGMSFIKERLPGEAAYMRQVVWKNAWALAISMAYVQLFELDDLPAAAEAFQEAARLPGAPEYISSLAERLRKPGGKYEVGLRLIQFMAMSETDNRVKERLEARRRSLFLSQTLFFLNRRFSSFLATRFPGLDSVSKDRREVEFRRFLETSGEQHSEPFGGAWVLTESGRIDSTTPREKVFGLD